MDRTQQQQQEKVSSLIAEINAAVKDSKNDVSSDNAGRARLLQASKQLSTVLERPEDAALGLAFTVSFG